ELRRWARPRRWCRPGRSVKREKVPAGDWRAKTLAQIRKIMRAADPEIVETKKWMGKPVFEKGGIICTGERPKAAVKMTFANGELLKDPAKLFNSSLEGNLRRAIDIREGEKINERALKALIRDAVALNLSGKKTTRPRAVR